MSDTDKKIKSIKQLFLFFVFFVIFYFFILFWARDETKTIESNWFQDVT